MPKIGDIWVCVQCEEVFDMRLSSDRRCPSCTGSGSVPLSRWLGSTAQVAAVRLVDPRDLFVDKKAIARAFEIN